jgi:hypothetical protein
VGAQRNTFGPLKISATGESELSFYTYIGTEFKYFYRIRGSEVPPLIGSPEIYWWPKYQILMARKADGYDWKTYKVTKDVVDVAQNPQKYNKSDQIEEGGFKNDMKFGG